jgi:hypothetical protein
MKLPIGIEPVIILVIVQKGPKKLDQHKILNFYSYICLHTYSMYSYIDINEQPTKNLRLSMCNLIINFSF